MLALENYIKNCTNSQAAIFGYLREMILSVAPGINEDVRNNTPVYEYYGNLCEVKKTDNGTMLTFSNGIELDDPYQDLISTESIAEKAIHFTSYKEIDTTKVLSFIKQAITSNRINAGKLENISVLY